MLEMEKKRDSIRKQMGYSEGEQVIFVIATWGPDAMFNTVGDELIEKIKACAGKYKFVLSVHPHEYRPRKDGKKSWGVRLRNVQNDFMRVREPSEDWAAIMIASDLILTDSTSLALQGVMLKKPFVYVRFPRDKVVKDSFVARLRDISPQLDEKADNFAQIIEATLKQYPFDKLDLIAKDINSCPNQSRQIMTENIYQMLQLEKG